MRHFLLSLIIFLLSFGVHLSICGEGRAVDRTRAPSDAKWVRLFDGKTLNGWYTFLQRQKKNEDPAKVFQVEDGVIHVYKDQTDGSEITFGYLASDLEYAYYHLRLEYKWGTKRFRPRANQRRDAGLLYHVLAPDSVWPGSIECQIQENDVGDCFTVRGTQVSTSVEIATVETPSGTKQLPRYKPEADGGKHQTIGGPSIARIVKSSTHEHDGWNTVEVNVRGSDGTAHVVNGDTVFQAKDLRRLNNDNKSWVPLAHGRIALQAEFAEVYYRNVEIQPIPDGPLHPEAPSN
jgi:hypothetical protein